MENVDELIEQYRQEAAQFTLSPRPAVWQHIDAEINPPRRKRRFFLIWFLFGALAALGFYVTGTHYHGHGTTDTKANKKPVATHETLPKAATIPTTDTEQITTQEYNKPINTKKTTPNTFIDTGNHSVPYAYAHVATTKHYISRMAATVNELPVRLPALPVAATVSLPQVWPYPIHQLRVKPKPMPAPRTTLQQPIATAVPAITAIPLTALVPQKVKSAYTRLLQLHTPHSRTIPAIIYPATVGLAHVPAKLLPLSPRVAAPQPLHGRGTNGTETELSRLSVVHTSQNLHVAPPVFPLLSPVAPKPTTSTLAGLAPLPAAQQTLPAIPQRLPEAALLGIGTTIGTSMKHLGIGKPTLLPVLPEWVQTPIVRKTPSDVVTAMFCEPVAVTTTITPMPHKILPTNSTNLHTPATHQKGWVLQSALHNHAPSLPIGPVAYHATDYTEEVDEVMSATNTNHTNANIGPLPPANLVLLATQPQPYHTVLRKIVQLQAVITDTNQHKAKQHRWALDITSGLSANKHTITEAGQYQFIRSYRDSTDAAIRTMNWSLGLRYAINNRVSLLLNGALLQTGEEMASRQRVYGTDTVLVNISSMGPTASFHKVIIAERNFDIGGDSTGRIRNKVTYASVGVGIRYHLLTTGKLSMGMQPSVSLAWRTGARMHTYDSTVQEWRVATKNEVVSRNTIAGFGLYAEYRISPSVSVSVMPHYTRYIGPVFRQSPVAVQYSQTSLLTTVTLWLP